MFFWQNSNLIYKNFLKFFSSKIFNSELKNYINFTNIKFEVKLYLIGLSFNRFLFNIDKLFINLCIISNFLFFLSNYNPKVLLVGNSKYSSYFKFFSYETNNVYYEYKLLPGSIIGTIEASNFASRNQFNIFNNNFDCIILFFYYPNIQFTKEICRRCIPIIGIIEIDSPKFILNTITYPLFSIENKENIFFYLSYFIKILENKFIKKNNYYSFKYTFNNEFKYTNNKTFLLNLFFNINIEFQITNKKDKPISFNDYFIYIIDCIYFLQKKLLLNKYLIITKYSFLINNIYNKIFKKKELSNVISFFLKSKKKKKFKKKDKKQWYIKKKELVLYINEILSLNKIEIYNMKNKKGGIIARIIYENSKKYPKWQQKLNERFNNPLRRKIKKKKQFKKNNELEKLSYWEWRKRTVFNTSKLPRFKKPKNRLKFAWPLKFLTKISSLCSPRFYIYYRKPKKILLKKKICIKKMIYYYYNIYFKKSLKGFVKFSKKQKHNLSLQYSNNFTSILESKLCIFLLRVRFASNIWNSKKFITKGYICVNGAINYNPGYLLNTNDIVQWVWESYIEYKTKYFKVLEPTRISKSFFFWKLKKFKNYGGAIKYNVKSRINFKLYYKFCFFFNTFFKKKSIKKKIEKKKFYFDVILQEEENILKKGVLI